MEPGDIVTVSVDRVILLDIAGQHPELIQNPPARVFDPSKISVVFDHFVPAPNVEMANGTAKIRKLVKRLNLNDFYDYGSGGIAHAFAAESGWFYPGQIVANTDSHSVAAGAFNMLSRGLGTPELMQVMCTGKTWFAVGETLKVDLSGKLSGMSEAKDVFLKMAGDLGDMPNMNIEFAGDGVRTLNMDQRTVISTMCAELSVEFAVFPGDEVLRSYVQERGVQEYSPVSPDPSASYAGAYQLDMSEVVPMAALPDSVAGNTRPVDDIQGIKVDQCTIGSCANGKLSDLEVAARILKGRKVHPGTRLIVTPATQSIYLRGMELGYIPTIVKAGGIVTNPTCGSCMGGHMGLLADGETAITSTTRNFKGRMGSRDARIYMASSATVAASAVAGEIVSPSSILGGS